MKHDTTFQDGIHAGLNAMHLVLVAATRDVDAACGYIARNEQNMAIGTVVTVHDYLQQATDLYKAVLAMHRFRP